MAPGMLGVQVAVPAHRCCSCPPVLFLPTDALSGGVMKIDKWHQAAILDMIRYGDIKPADTIKHRIRITSNDLGHPASHGQRVEAQNGGQLEMSSDL